MRFNFKLKLGLRVFRLEYLGCTRVSIFSPGITSEKFLLLILNATNFWNVSIKMSEKTLKIKKRSKRTSGVFVCFVFNLYNFLKFLFSFPGRSDCKILEIYLLRS